MEWKKITINANLIKYSTDKAVLIKLPKTDFCFWHPKKLVRESSKGKGYWLDISFTNDFIFKCERKSEKTRQVLDSKEYSANDILDFFNQEPFEQEKKDFGYNIPEQEIVVKEEVLSELSN